MIDATANYRLLLAQGEEGELLLHGVESRFGYFRSNGPSRSLHFWEQSIGESIKR